MYIYFIIQSSRILYGGLNCYLGTKVNKSAKGKGLEIGIINQTRVAENVYLSGIKGGRIAHFTSELIKSGLMRLKHFQVDH